MNELVSPKFHTPLLPESLAEHDRQDEFGYTKWPVWLRTVIILGLSAGLWTLIIAGLVMLLA